MFLLVGTDHYLLKLNTEKILKESKINHDDLEVYDLEETLVQNAVESAMTIPFLSDMKAVVLTNATFLASYGSAKTLDHDLSVLEVYVKNPNPTTIFIVQAPYEKLDKRQNLTKTLLDHMDQIDCNPDRNEDIFLKIKTKLQENGLAIDANALQVFVSRIGSDRDMLFGELDKLITYALGKDKINVDMVKAIVYRNPEDHIYQLVNAIIEQDQQMLIDIYNDLLAANTDPMWILGAIVSKFQEILYTKELIRLNFKFDDIMKYFAATKGRTYFIMKNANSTSEARLEEYLGKLETLDADIKTGKIDKKIGLELFIMRMYA